MTEIVEFFEIVLPRCANTYGVAPCTAAIPTTGDAKCFNSLATCQDTENFVDTTATLRFAKPASFLPRDIDIVGPWIKSIDHTPAVISLAENLGTRSVLKVTLEDHPHSDAGAGLDKYQADRGYDPYERGSFWPRLRARYPSLTGFACAWVIGEVGQDYADMERRSFFIESGPTGDGTVSITAKDALKFLDGDRAQIPVLSEGSLLGDISASVTSLTVTPSGAGTDYPATGYANLAGKEIVSYSHDLALGNDANCLLLLHFLGADASTTFTDSSSAARTVTANGNVQIDTAQSVFGGSSALFDGSGDYLSLADNAVWTQAGDFTFECRVRHASLADFRAILSHGTDGNNKYQLFTAANGRIVWEVKSASSTIVTMSSAAGVFTTGTWQHVALVRSGNVWTIYVDGVSVATTTDSDAIPNFTGTFKIGIDQDGSSNAFNGWIDEFRFSNIARWTAGFTVPTWQYESSVDVFTIVRGELNTTASTHSAGDRVQLVKRYSAQAAADIIYDAIVNYTDLASSYIPLAEWQLEDSTNLGTLYSFTLGEPVGVGAFVSRVLEQCGAMMWDDALEQLLRFKVIREVPTAADVISESNVLNRTFEATDQPDQRVSRAWVYYGQNDPTKRRDDLDNYRQSSKRPDDATAEQGEALYGAQAIKKIIADGIAIGGGSVAERVGNLVVGRKQRPPRRFKWSMLRGETLPVLGGGYFIDWRSLQDASGAREQVPIQIISEKVSPSILQYLAEEMRFTDLDAGSSLDRVFLLNFNGRNINLRDIHDASYPSEFDGVTVTFIISALFGSTSTTTPAIDVGDWPIGFTPTVEFTSTGRAQGRGGNGGNQGQDPTTGVPPFATPGQAGGLAFYTRHPVNVEFPSGAAIKSGGGGGAGGSSGWGGGGAGDEGGSATSPAQPGTLDAGGLGSGFFAVQQSGAAPGTAAPAVGSIAGGAAGVAIDGVSYITFTVSGGTIAGSQIN